MHTVFNFLILGWVIYLIETGHFNQFFTIFSHTFFSKIIFYQQNKDVRTKHKDRTKQKLSFALDVSVSVQHLTIKLTVSGKVLQTTSSSLSLILINEVSGAVCSRFENCEF